MSEEFTYPEESLNRCNTCGWPLTMPETHKWFEGMHHEHSLGMYVSHAIAAQKNWPLPSAALAPVDEMRQHVKDLWTDHYSKNCGRPEAEAKTDIYIDNYLATAVLHIDNYLTRIGVRP